MQEITSESRNLGRGVQITCFLTGIVWPIVCFALAVKGFPGGGPRWQSGAWSDICSLMLGGYPSYALYPLLIFSIVSLGCFLGWEDWARRQMWVRVGVYGGLIFAIVLSWVFAYANGAKDAADVVLYMLLGNIIPVTGLIYAKYCDSWQQRYPTASAAALAITILLAGLSLVTGVGVFICLGFAPWFTLLGFALASVHLFKSTASRHYGIVSLLAGVSWLSALAASLKVCYDRAMQHYQTLPTEYVSDCFIVTAAAQGHPWLVGSWSTRNGRKINRQLVLFKALELTLAGTCPATHRSLRRHYDRLAPRIARLISNRWMADATYLLLKPLEVVCKWVSGL